MGELTQDQIDRLQTAHQKMVDGDLVPLSIENNKIKWQ
jgi:hypothetical protein